MCFRRNVIIAFLIIGLIICRRNPFAFALGDTTLDAVIQTEEEEAKVEEEEAVLREEKEAEAQASVSIDSTLPFDGTSLSDSLVDEETTVAGSETTTSTTTELNTGVSTEGGTSAAIEAEVDTGITAETSTSQVGVSAETIVETGTDLTP